MFAPATLDMFSTIELQIQVFVNSQLFVEAEAAAVAAAAAAAKSSQKMVYGKLVFGKQREAEKEENEAKQQNSLTQAFHALLTHLKIFPLASSTFDPPSTGLHTTFLSFIDLLLCSLAPKCR